MKIEIPELCLVVLIGASGAGKSSFARRHFLPTEIVSSDFCRGVVEDDETSLEATNDAFDLLHFIVAKRLKRGKLTIIDATNVQKEARVSLLKLARQFHVQTVAIAFNIKEEICLERNLSRPDRQFGPHVVRNHSRQLRQSLRTLEKEGFRYIHVLRSPEEVADAEIARVPLWNNRKDETGPFDIIGDVHGCAAELEELLEKLDYARDANGVFRHPNRKAIFLGDLVDRGPQTAQVLKIAMPMIQNGAALGVAGNHDVKLERFLKTGKGKITHGMQNSLDSLAEESEDLTAQTKAFLGNLISHYVLDGGKLVVAHAGLKEAMQGRASGAVRSFCLYGDTTGETDEWGLPERLNWANDYRGKAAVIYGHTPVPRADWLNNTLNIDTGCVFGGELTALRWPERELISVKARETYAESARPFLETALESAQMAHDELLDVGDFSGKQLIETALMNKVTIRAENGAAALEILSRFGANPKWLAYLPPTMSPAATSNREGFLEFPDQAFSYFAEAGVEKVICQEKHMGSRAVVVVARDADAAKARFGVDGEIGAILTRTGRRFFEDLSRETELLERLQRAVSGANLWEELGSDWLLLDCELMPWSAKAQELLQRQYAPVAYAGENALSVALEAIEKAANNGLEIENLRAHFAQRKTQIKAYRAAYGHYCWNVESVEDLRLAPFHLLASEKAVHTDKNHLWHMENLAKLALFDPIFVATPYKIVDLNEENSREMATNWWLELTRNGGEGMVVKPLDFVAKGEKGLVQPALKIRGREYLRIIYGPEYDAPENLERLRARGLAAKRALALREFALGLEGLERFVRREPLRGVHQCAWGVLALESEPVDPRL